MRTKTLAAALIVGLALLAAFVSSKIYSNFSATGSVAHTVNEPRHVDVDQVAADDGTSNRDRAKTDAASLHLPPVSVPLRHSVAALKEAVRAGNAQAACRLAAEFTAYARLDLNINQLDNFMSSSKAPSGVSDPLPVITLPGDTGELRLDAEHCHAVPIASRSEIIDLWRTAAHGGHLPSMVHYATGGPFDSSAPLESLEALATYKSEAERLAERAAASGEPYAVLALAAAYSPYNRDLLPSLLAQAVESDVVKSLSLYYYFLGEIDPAIGNSEEARVFVDRKIAELEVIASSTQLVRAREEASRLRSAWRRPNTSMVVGYGGLGRGRAPEVKSHQCVPG